MFKERKPRGFKVLKRYSTTQKTVMLCARNNTVYIVLANYYFWGICLRSRFLEFQNENEAADYFLQLCKEKRPSLTIVR